MFEILFPLTGSAIDEKALPHVLDMAQLFNGRVHLVRVLGSRRASDRPIDPVDWHVNKLEAEASLSRAAASLRAADVDVVETLLEGNPTEHLVNYARQQNADLVILGSGPERHSFGAAAGELLYRSYLSTLLLRMRGTTSSPRLTQEADRSRERPFRRGSGLESRRIDDHAFGSHALSATLGQARAMRWTPVDVGNDARSVAAKPAPTGVAGSWQGAAAGPSGLVAGGPQPPGPLIGPGSGVQLTSYLGEETLRLSDGPRSGGAGDSAAPQFQPRAPQAARYGRILTALDGSKRAECVFPWVRRMAERHEAAVILAHVVVEPALPRLTPPSQEDMELSRRLIERNRHEATAYLQDAKNRLGVAADVRVLQGSKAAVLLHDLVEEEGVDLVVLSAHGYGGESRWPFGDVATSFIDYGGTPLLIVQDMERGADQIMDVTAEKWAG